MDFKSFTHMSPWELERELRRAQEEANRFEVRYEFRSYNSYADKVDKYIDDIETELKKMNWDVWP